MALFVPLGDQQLGVYHGKLDWLEIPLIENACIASLAMVNQLVFTSSLARIDPLSGQVHKPFSNPTVN